MTRTALTEAMSTVPNMHGESKILDKLSFFFYLPQFDSVGNTGGCQASYTVIPSLSTPNCSNVTFPPLLDVLATTDHGRMSQFDWIDQVRSEPLFGSFNNVFASALTFRFYQKMERHHTRSLQVTPHIAC